MKIGRLHIGFWFYPNSEDKKFIWFELLNPCCGCKLLTILNVLFTWQIRGCNENNL